MSKPNITIIVAGEAGCGKSTIAAQIYNLLTISGFKVKYTNDDEPHLPIQEIAKRYLNLVLDKTVIEVKTQQIAREPQVPKEPVDIESPLYKTIIRIICSLLGVDSEIIKPESDFIKDLGADSLDTVELIMSAEEEFGILIEDEHAEEMKTVADAYRYLKEHTCR